METLHRSLDLDLISGYNLDTRGECDHLERSDGDAITHRGDCPDGQQVMENEVLDQMEV